MRIKQAYEVEGIRSDDETPFTVEVLDCGSEDEAKGLAQHYADLWRCTVKLSRATFVNKGSDPWAAEQMHFICRLEPTNPPGHSA
jgi:hypothetical protein